MEGFEERKPPLIIEHQATRLLFNETALTVAEAHQLMYFDFLNVCKLKRALGSSALSDKCRDVFATRLNKLEIDSETDL